MRSGTTSLYAYLSQHPEVFLPVPKVRIFSVRCRLRAGQDLSALSDGNARQAGEILEPCIETPTVSGDQASAVVVPLVSRRAAKVEAVAPAAKIMIVLRDRAARLLALPDGVSRRRPTPALPGRSRRGPAPPNRSLGRFVNYVERGFYITPGLYAQHVRRYLQTFGRSRVKILLFEDFVRSRWRYLRRYGVLEVGIAQLRGSILPSHTMPMRYRVANLSAGSRG